MDIHIPDNIVVGEDWKIIDIISKDSPPKEYQLTRKENRVQIIQIHRECVPGIMILYPKHLSERRLVHSKVVQQLKPYFRQVKIIDQFRIDWESGFIDLPHDKLSLLINSIDPEKYLIKVI